jgi:hypothetical protein
MPLIGLRRGGGIVYIVIVKQEIVYRGWLRYKKKQQYSNQLITRTIYPSKGSSSS